MVNFLQESLQNHLPSHKKTPSGWVSINCPMCVHMGEPTHDKNKKGGFLFNVDGSIGYHCFRCKYATKWTVGSALNNKFRTLMYNIGYTSEEIRMLQFETIQQVNIYDKNTTQKENKNFIKPEFTKKKLPEKSKKISELVNEPNDDFLNVIQYIDNRNEHLFECDLYWSPKYKKRFIIPFMYKNEIVGWTARYCGTTNKKIPKYISDKPKDYLYNSEALYYNDREVVIIVEGVLDAISLDCVAVLGNSISDFQKKWINDTDKKIILLPDFDQSKSNLVKEAKDQNWHISFPGWDVKDADEAVKKYGKIYALKLILENSTNNKLKIDLNMKKLRML